MLMTKCRMILRKLCRSVAALNRLDLGYLLNTCCHGNPMQRRSFSWSRYLCAQKWLKRQERERTVFQYAGKDPKRADRIYGWGFAESGALGVKSFIRPPKKLQRRDIQFVPFRLTFFDELGLSVKDAAAGYGFSLFVCQLKEDTSKQLLYGTGVNTDNQLGYHESPPKSGRILGQIIEPAVINLPLQNRSSRIRTLSCGRAHSVILTEEAVFSLGNNSYGQCGRGIVDGEDYQRSQLINRLDIDHNNIKQIECGQDHTLVVMETGEVLACGLSADGQTGQDDYKVLDRFMTVKGDIVGEKIIKVSSRADCILALSDKGELFGWGNSEYSQLACVAGDQTQVNLARHLPFTSVGMVTDVATAGSMCALVNDNGDVYVWGYGILGKGPKVESSEWPTLLPPTLFGRNEFSPDTKVTNIAAGLTYFMALSDAGDIYSWGKNKSAVLGLAHEKDQYFPYKVLVPAEVKKIVSGVDHVFALTKAYV